MLLDNKNKTEDSPFYKVYEFLLNNTEHGKIDLVSGYFSVNALARMHEEMHQVEKFYGKRI